MNALRFSAVVALLALGAGQLVAKTHPLPSKRQGKRLITRVRTMSAKVIDPSQEDVPLEQWLHVTFGPENKFIWELSGCDLKAGPEFPEQWGACVQVHSWNSGVYGLKLHILIANSEEGELKTPLVQPQSFMWKCPSKCPQLIQMPCSLSVRRLADISAHIRALAKDPKCNSFGSKQ